MRAYGLIRVAAWNPLNGFPRNAPCFCGKPIKAKKCCLPKMRRAVPAGDAKVVAPLVKKLRKELK